MIIRLHIVILRVTLKRRFTRKTKSSRIHLRLLFLQKSMILQHIPNPLLLLLNHNFRLHFFNHLLLLKHRGRVTCISLFLWCFYNDSLLSVLFTTSIRSLYGRVTYLFAFSFVQFAHNVYILHYIGVYFKTLLRIKFLFFKH